MGVVGCLGVYLRLPLKDDHSASFVPCGQELASVVKLNSGDYISWRRERSTDGTREKERERESEGGWKQRDRIDPLANWPHQSSVWSFHLPLNKQSLLQNANAIRRITFAYDCTVSDMNCELFPVLHRRKIFMRNSTAQTTEHCGPTDTKWRTYSFCIQLQVSSELQRDTHSSHSRSDAHHDTSVHCSHVDLCVCSAVTLLKKN